LNVNDKNRFKKILKKKKGENNEKNGNKHLYRAYVEAANFAIRYDTKAQVEQGMTPKNFRGPDESVAEFIKYVLHERHFPDDFLP
jgi:hypothetical protein